MVKTRIIPVLLLKSKGLVKTIKFKDYAYVGDPINAVKIFNDKGADELVFLDIEASCAGAPPDFAIIESIAGECFMPLCYGGGITSIEQMRRIFNLGVEKIAINSYAFEYPGIISQAAARFGSQSIVVSIDVKKSFWGKYEAMTRGGRETSGMDPVSAAKLMEQKGAGEIMLNCIDRDGTMQGYDLDLIGMVAREVSIPVIACGGAGRMDDLALAVVSGASAAAAGSLFVFHGKNRAVLINYPSAEEMDKYFSYADKSKNNE